MSSKFKKGKSKKSKKQMTSLVGRQRMPRGELKYTDTHITTTVDNNGYVTYISGMAQGGDNNNRQGRVIRVVSLSMNYTITINSLAVASQVRCILFSDVQSNGVLPAVTDVLDVAATLTSNYNIRTAPGRFKILYDHIFPLAIAGADTVTGHKGMKVNLPVNFISTGAVIANAGKNSLYCLLISNEAANLPKPDIFARIRFYDN